MRQQNRNFKICSVWFSLITFTCTSFTSAPAAHADAVVSSTANHQNISSLKVPEVLAKVEKLELGADAAGPSVIVIQDAHSIPDAQRSIRKTILFLEKGYGVSLIGVEGAAGELDTRIFQSYPDQEALQKVFKGYMDKGEMTGSVAAAVFGLKKEMRTRGVEFFGVEDWPVYEEGLGLYLAAMGEEEKITKQLEVRSLKLEEEKRKAYSKELLEVDQAQIAFEGNSKDLLAYLKTLAAIQTPAAGSEIALLLSESDKGQTDDTALDAEIRQIAARLKLRLGHLSPQGQKSFSEKYQSFQTSQMSAAQFALALKDLSVKEGFKLPMSQSMAHQAVNQRRMRDLEGTKLFEDIEAYTKGIKEALFRNDIERQLDEQTHELILLKKWAKLELSREDWSEVKSKLEVGSLELGGGAQKAEIDSVFALDLRPSNSELQTLFKYHKAFYENAERRDESFVRNLQKRLKPGQTAVIIAGGFHAQGLAQHLKDEGINHALVMPNIAKLPDQSAYREQMKGNVDWKSYFEVKNGRINLYDAFVRYTRDQLLGRQQKGTQGEDLQDRDPRMLKNWRDQIIRNLADEGKLEKAGEYTRFIDETVTSEKKKDLEARMAEVERFIAGLKDLDAKGQFTAANITKLLQPQGAGFTAAGVAPGVLNVAGKNSILAALAKGAVPARIASRVGSVSRVSRRARANAVKLQKARSEMRVGETGLIGEGVWRSQSAKAARRAGLAQRRRTLRSAPRIAGLLFDDRTVKGRADKASVRYDQELRAQLAAQGVEMPEGTNVFMGVPKEVQIPKAIRPNSLPLFIDVSADLKTIRYFVVPAGIGEKTFVQMVDRGNAGEPFMVITPEAMIDENGRRVMPEQFLTTPSVKAKDFLVAQAKSEEHKRLIRNLLDPKNGFGKRRSLRYQTSVRFGEKGKGQIMTTWDSSVDKGVWTTMIDTVYLHKEMIDSQVLTGPAAASYQKVMEVGVGGGHNIAAMAAHLAGVTDVTYTDISPYALSVSKRMIEENLPAERQGKIKHHAILGSGVVSLIQRERQDFILMNPPYIPFTAAQKTPEYQKSLMQQLMVLDQTLAKTDHSERQPIEDKMHSIVEELRAIRGETPYAGTKLIDELMKYADQLLSDNPAAMIVLNVSSLSDLDMPEYIANHGDKFFIEPLGETFGGLTGKPISVPLKIESMPKVAKDYFLESGLMEKHSAEDVQNLHVEEYSHRIHIYAIRLKNSRGAADSARARLRERLRMLNPARPPTVTDDEIDQAVTKAFESDPGLQANFENDFAGLGDLYLQVWQSYLPPSLSYAEQIKLLAYLHLILKDQESGVFSLNLKGLLGVIQDEAALQAVKSALAKHSIAELKQLSQSAGQSVNQGLDALRTTFDAQNHVLGVSGLKAVVETLRRSEVRQAVKEFENGMGLKGAVDYPALRSELNVLLSEKKDITAKIDGYPRTLVKSEQPNLEEVFSWATDKVNSDRMDAMDIARVFGIFEFYRDSGGYEKMRQFYDFIRKHYPDQSKFLNDISVKELYVVSLNKSAEGRLKKVTKISKMEESKRTEGDRQTLTAELDAAQAEMEQAFSELEPLLGREDATGETFAALGKAWRNVATYVETIQQGVINHLDSKSPSRAGWAVQFYNAHRSETDREMKSLELWYFVEKDYEGYAEGFLRGFEFYPGHNAVLALRKLGKLAALEGRLEEAESLSTQAEGLAALVFQSIEAAGGVEKGDQYALGTMIQLLLFKAHPKEGLDENLYAKGSTERQQVVLINRVLRRIEEYMRITGDIDEYAQFDLDNFVKANENDKTAKQVLAENQRIIQLKKSGVKKINVRVQQGGVGDRLFSFGDSVNNMSQSRLLPGNFRFNGQLPDYLVNRSDLVFFKTQILNRNPLQVLEDIAADLKRADAEMAEKLQGVLADKDRRYWEAKKAATQSLLKRTLDFKADLEVTSELPLSIIDLKDEPLFNKMTDIILRYRFETQTIEALHSPAHEIHDESALGLIDVTQARITKDSTTTLAAAYLLGIADCREHGYTKMLLFDMWKGHTLSGLMSEYAQINFSTKENKSEIMANLLSEIQKVSRLQLYVFDAVVRANFDMEKYYEPKRNEAGELIYSDSIQDVEGHTLNILLEFDSEGRVARAVLRDSFYQGKGAEQEEYKWGDLEVIGKNDAPVTQADFLKMLGDARYWEADFKGVREVSNRVLNHEWLKTQLVLPEELDILSQTVEPGSIEESEQRYVLHQLTERLLTMPDLIKHIDAPTGESSPEVKARAMVKKLGWLASKNFEVMNDFEVLNLLEMNRALLDAFFYDYVQQRSEGLPAGYVTLQGQLAGIFLRADWYAGERMVPATMGLNVAVARGQVVDVAGIPAISREGIDQNKRALQAAHAEIKRSEVRINVTPETMAEGLSKFIAGEVNRVSLKLNTAAGVFTFNAEFQSEGGVSGVTFDKKKTEAGPKDFEGGLSLRDSFGTEAERRQRIAEAFKLVVAAQQAGIVDLAGLNDAVAVAMRASISLTQQTMNEGVTKFVAGEVNEVSFTSDDASLILRGEFQNRGPSRVSFYKIKKDGTEDFKGGSSLSDSFGTEAERRELIAAIFRGLVSVARQTPNANFTVLNEVAASLGRANLKGQAKYEAFFQKVLKNYATMENLRNSRESAAYKQAVDDLMADQLEMRRTLLFFDRTIPVPADVSIRDLPVGDPRASPQFTIGIETPSDMNMLTHEQFDRQLKTGDVIRIYKFGEESYNQFWVVSKVEKAEGAAKVFGYKMNLFMDKEDTPSEEVDITGLQGYLMNYGPTVYEMEQWQLKQPLALRSEVRATAEDVAGRLVDLTRDKTKSIGVSEITNVLLVVAPDYDPNQGGLRLPAESVFNAILEVLKDSNVELDDDSGSIKDKNFYDALLDHFLSQTKAPVSVTAAERGPKYELEALLSGVEKSARSEVRNLIVGAADGLADHFLNGVSRQALYEEIALNLTLARRRGASVEEAGQIIRDTIRARIQAEMKASVAVTNTRFTPQAIGLAIDIILDNLQANVLKTTDGEINLAIETAGRDSQTRIKSMVQALKRIHESGLLGRVLLSSENAGARRSFQQEFDLQGRDGMIVSPVTDLKRVIADLSNQSVVPAVHDGQDILKAGDLYVGVGLNPDMKESLSDADIAQLETLEAALQIAASVLLAQELDSSDAMKTQSDKIRGDLVRKLMGVQSFKLVEQAGEGVLQITSEGELSIVRQGLAAFMQVLQQNAKAIEAARQAA